MSEREYLQPGFETETASLTRSSALQAERLKCCGVNPAAFGTQGNEQWAPGLLGTDCFVHLGDVGQSIKGSVHTEMRLYQLRPVPLAQRLKIQGRTEKVADAAKGQIVTMAFTFTDDQGEAPLRADLDVLIPDPERMTAPTQMDNTHPPSDPRLGYAKFAARQLKPIHVQTYGGARNPIHLDPEYAASLGFRAPIAHGVMTAVWLLGALDNPQAPSALEASFIFRRPVFWDDAMELWKEEGGVCYRSLNDAGKMTAEMTVNRTSV